jgi:hypothetical protein
MEGERIWIFFCLPDSNETFVDFTVVDFSNVASTAKSETRRNGCSRTSPPSLAADARGINVEPAGWSSLPLIF